MTEAIVATRTSVGPGTGRGTSMTSTGAPRDAVRAAAGQRVGDRQPGAAQRPAPVVHRPPVQPPVAVVRRLDDHLAAPLGPALAVHPRPPAGPERAPHLGGAAAVELDRA